MVEVGYNFSLVYHTSLLDHQCPLEASETKQMVMRAPNLELQLVILVKNKIISLQLIKHLGRLDAQRLRLERSLEILISTQME